MSDTTVASVGALLLQRWRIMVIGAVIGAAAATVYLVLAPNWYQATLTVIPSQQSRSTLALGLSARLPDVLDSGSTDVQRIRAVLTSNSVADKVVEKFDLGKRYEQAHRELIRKTLWRHCSTSIDKKADLVALSCEDKDPKFAMEMTTYFGEVGNQVFGRVSASSAREERQFLEVQVGKAKDEVDTASKELRAFQEKNKIVDLPEQSKAVISAMASIEGDLMSKQLELSYLDSFSSRTEASVVQLRQQIGIMERKLRELEATAAIVASNAGSAASKEFFPAAMTVPSLRYELESLLRQQKIKETLFFLMTQRFEMAKVDEARDTSTFQILDYPTLPSHRSRPVRTKTVALGLVGGACLGALWIVGAVWMRRRRKQTQL